MEAENKVLELKLKKAMLLTDIEGLQHAPEALFTLLGKTEAEIHKLQIQLINTTKNTFQDR